ncbi:MAG: RpiB/LacA/LacB family sugar-phosphate isomerase [Patescibacteria group bacterium UBA2163]
MKVYIGADHRGYQDKEVLKQYLIESGYTVEDMGAFEEDSTDDYPDFAYPVAQAVARDSEARGILLCGSGMGMDVVANKVRGVRATVGYSKESVHHARAHDDINVITLAADVLNESEVREYADVFLATERDPAERHQRRLDKITRIEHEEC